MPVEREDARGRGERTSDSLQQEEAREVTQRLTFDGREVLRLDEGI